MKKIRIFTFIAFILLLAIPTCAAVGDNLCENASVIEYSGAVAAEDEQVEFCIDGNISTKWCTGGSDKNEYLNSIGVRNYIVLDFGESKYFNTYQLFHASLCERDFGETQYDAVSWAVEISDDLETWTEISRVTDNKEAYSEIETELVSARYIRFLFLQENNNGDSMLRLSEIKVIESDASGNVSENVSSDTEQAIQAIEDAENLRIQEEENEKIEVLVLILMIISMVISLTVFYILKFINHRSQKGGNK